MYWINSVWSKLNVKLHSTPLTLKIIILALVGLNSKRTQRVMIKDALSGIGHLHAGVPQGSVLDPLMFLILLYQMLCLYQQM
jgi:hypothetical protein